MNNFKLLLFIILVLKLLLNGLATTIDSFCDFYNYEQNNVSKKIINANGIGRYLWYYTGLDTGYGFFAPNVSSNFIILSKLENGETYVSTDLLSTKEGKLKFLTLNSIFLDNVKNGFKPIDKEKKKYNHAILNQINKFSKKKYQNQKVESKVFLYDFPRLIARDKQTNLLPIDSIR